MNIKRNINFLVNDLKGTSGFGPFIYALFTSFFILGILAGLVWFVCVGQANFLEVCAGLSITFFILDNFGRDKKLEKMESQIKDDEITIKKLSKKDISIDYNTLNRKMKEFQDE